MFSCHSEVCPVLCYYIGLGWSWKSNTKMVLLANCRFYFPCCPWWLACLPLHSHSKSKCPLLLKTHYLFHHCWTFQKPASPPLWIMWLTFPSPVTAVTEFVQNPSPDLMALPSVRPQRVWLCVSTRACVCVHVFKCTMAMCVGAYACV